MPPPTQPLQTSCEWFPSPWLGLVSATLLEDIMCDSETDSIFKVNAFKVLFGSAQRRLSFTFLNEQFYAGIVQMLKRRGESLGMRTKLAIKIIPSLGCVNPSSWSLTQPRAHLLAKIMVAESLDLRGVWLRNSSRESFVSGIRKLRYLRKLSIPYVANDDLLAALAKSCPELRHLDLAGASEITKAGAEQLYRAVQKSGR